MPDTCRDETEPALPGGWSALDAERAAGLVERLAFEVSARHLLSGVAVEAIAARHSNDDVLYRHVVDRSRYTVVHLTWSSGRQTSPCFPSVEFDGTFEEFLESERCLAAELGR